MRTSVLMRAIPPQITGTWDPMGGEDGRAEFHSRTCKKCMETKPLGEFDMRADTRTRRWTCRACRRAYQRARWDYSSDASRSGRTVGVRDEYPCRRCGQMKPPDAFPRRAEAPHRLHSWCRSCFSKYKAERHARNREREIRRIQRNHRRAVREHRQRVSQYLMTHPCVDCGETDTMVLEFDHLRDKLMQVSRMVHTGWRWAAIAAEIEKCEVRCANCHRRVTRRREVERNLSSS
jgi:hypothetical protein